MSDQSDSQNKSEEQVNLSEGTSPFDSYDDATEVLLATCLRLLLGRGGREILSLKMKTT